MEKFEGRFVYFIRCFQYIKIGMTTELAGRIRSFESNCPFEFEILGVISVPKGISLHKVEMSIQKKFYSDHFRYEWFQDSKQIRSFIDEKCEKITIPSHMLGAKKMIFSKETYEFAYKHGNKPGRPKIIDENMAKSIIDSRNSGTSIRNIASKFNIGKSSVLRVLQNNDISSGNSSMQKKYIRTTI